MLTTLEGIRITEAPLLNATLRPRPDLEPHKQHFCKWCWNIDIVLKTPQVFLMCSQCAKSHQPRAAVESHCQHI